MALQQLKFETSVFTGAGRQESTGEGLARLITTGMQAYEKKQDIDRVHDAREEKELSEDDSMLLNSHFLTQNEERRKFMESSPSLEAQEEYERTAQVKTKEVAELLSSEMYRSKTADIIGSHDNTIDSAQLKSSRMTSKKMWEELKLSSIENPLTSIGKLKSDVESLNELGKFNGEIFQVEDLYDNYVGRANDEALMNDKPLSFDVKAWEEKWSMLGELKNPKYKKSIEATKRVMSNRRNEAYETMVDGGIAQAYDDNGIVDVSILEKIYRDNKSNISKSKYDKDTMLKVQDDLLSRINKAKGTSTGIPSNTQKVIDNSKHTMENGDIEWEASLTIDTSTAAGLSAQKRLQSSAGMKSNVSRFIKKKDWANLKKFASSNGMVKYRGSQYPYDSSEAKNYISNYITSNLNMIDTIDVNTEKGANQYKLLSKDIYDATEALGQRTNPFKEKQQRPYLDTSVDFKSVDDVIRGGIVLDATLNENDKNYFALTTANDEVKNSTQKYLTSTKERTIDTDNEFLVKINNIKTNAVRRSRDSKLLTDKGVNEASLDWDDENPKSFKANFTYFHNHAMKNNKHLISLGGKYDADELTAIADASSVEYSHGLGTSILGVFTKSSSNQRIPKENADAIKAALDDYYDNEFNKEASLASATPAGLIVKSGMRLFSGDKYTGVKGFSDTIITIIDKDTVHVVNPKTGDILKVLTTEDGNRINAKKD